MRLGAGATGTPVLLQAPSMSPRCHVQTASLWLWGEMMTGVPGGVLVGGRGLPLPWLPAHDSWLAGLDDPTAAEEGGSLTEKASGRKQKELSGFIVVWGVVMGAAEAQTTLCASVSPSLP